jgi:predicted deacylase
MTAVRRVGRALVLAATLAALAGAAAAQAPAPEAPATPADPLPPPVTGPERPWGPIEIAGVEVEPGRRVRTGFATSESFAGVAVEAPFVISRGASPGPTLCLVAGVHGDELIGIEVVRRVLMLSEPVELAGTLVGVPIANPHGFQRSSRYLPDRRDLNRFFPGSPQGSAASRIAHALFAELVARCDYLVDFHTGSFHRTNIPHLRADTNLPDVALLARRFGSEIVLHNVGAPGTLRRSATDRGLPCVTYEAGEPMRLYEEDIAAGVDGSLRLMRELGMRWGEQANPGPTQEIIRSARWIRVDAGGLLRSHVTVGDRVDSGDRLGTVVDPSTNRRSAIFSPISGRIVGMALDQVVIPGFAAYHVGTASPLPPFPVPPGLPSFPEPKREGDPEELPE